MAVQSKIPTIYHCDSTGRENHTVAADMHGTLLIGRSLFPYFALVAFDVGGILRLLLLLLAAPLAWFLQRFVSESAGVRVLIFVSFAGVRVSEIESAANAVLPKHYSEDLHPQTWRVLSSCGRKCVLTECPRIMVEPFLKNYLGVDFVLGTEISSWRGVATGFVASGGVLVGEGKAVALRKAFESSSAPEIGIADSQADFPFLNLCKERYIVPSEQGLRPVKQEELPKPVIFHDGRLVRKPSPFIVLLIILWFPIGVLLSISRLLIGSNSPISLFYYIIQLTGCKIIVKGTPPRTAKNSRRTGVAFVCSHKNVMDPLFVSAVLRRSTTCVGYSVSRFTEFMSPIRNCRLTETDPRMLK
ncbi:Glycerol-3-phosphate acyltransferase RAM2 [Sesamum alatum]|uniref:Glycerol-3-phosphate acyltransferase RAM2 n=1 Tax=Sesamum alatum TaxID=300844 RepID=A0AAE1YD23_9LAMI|nr:Glycerol-3-phosphate acyltransferase RAM2 [Sesamum alatum]